MLLPFHPAHSGPCFAASYKQQIHKYPQFHDLNFIEAHVKGRYFLRWWLFLSLEAATQGFLLLWEPLLWEGDKGRLARTVLGGGHQEPPGSSQGGCTCSNFYDLHGGESFRVFSTRWPFSSPFLFTLLYGLLPSPFFMFVTNTYHRYSYLFCCCCC